MEEITVRALEIGILTLGGAFSMIWNHQRSQEREVFDRLRALEIEIGRLRERIETYAD
tara:strand:+ start:744 stop:917 length:174 start_codon:yes stop_codon:yes gene_type:complete